METPLSIYDRSKRQAKRLLLAGDLERYLHLLARIHALRMSHRSGLA